MRILILIDEDRIIGFAQVPQCAQDQMLVAVLLA